MKYELHTPNDDHISDAKASTIINMLAANHDASYP